jgi:dUTP pyrophosphatase
MTTLRFSKVREVKTPQRGTPGSAGVDFFVPEGVINDITTIGAHMSKSIPSGIRADVPEGFALVAFNKSGIALKKNLIVGACVVDSDYQGEIHLHVMNVGGQPACIQPGEKLVQFLLLPVNHCSLEEVQDDELFQETTVRGDGAFGSTGVS